RSWSFAAKFAADCDAQIKEREPKRTDFTQERVKLRPETVNGYKKTTRTEKILSKFSQKQEKFRPFLENAPAAFRRTRLNVFPSVMLKTIAGNPSRSVNIPA
ncbi:MAG: hypothetical protein FWE95_00640, partial [Planctomycetaceae bacterium]|nr:hypothetical protein [Planctomycetaceae bacterium]